MRAANAALIGPVASPRTEVGALVISTANELDIGLEDLLKSEELFNGDTLIIDYVQDPSITQIDPKSYT